MMTFSLKGRTAVITGGSSGIGAAIAKLFSEHGASVAVCHYRDAARAGELVSDIGSRGGRAFSTECDVSDPTSVDRMAATVKEAFDRVDIVVNSAGIGGDKDFTDLSIEDWDRMIGVHLRGTFLVTRAFFADMLDRGFGRIINISSQLAYKGAPGLAHYCAAKAGIVGFTRALAYEGAKRGVTVNSIAPGPVETELLMGLSDDWRAMKQAQLPLGRFGRVDEIAPAALMLAADSGAFYVGQTLSPNGGDVML